MRFRTVLAILGVLTIFVSGCGSDESSSIEESSSVSAESEERSTSTSGANDASTTSTTRASNNNATPTTAGAPSTTAAAPAPAPAPRADTAPVIILAGCRAGRVMNVRTAVAGASPADKWGVVAVEVTRVNDEGAQVTQGLRWLGAEYGAGDEWSATIPGGVGWANSVTIMATTFTNKTTRQAFSLVGTPC